MKSNNMFQALEKWVIYAIYALLIIASLNTCNSCKSNSDRVLFRKDIIKLQHELDSTNAVVKKFMETSATKDDIIENNDKQMSKFLFWEREADKPQYEKYTPKDYEDLIKEKK